MILNINTTEQEDINKEVNAKNPEGHTSAIQVEPALPQAREGRDGVSGRRDSQFASRKGNFRKNSPRNRKPRSRRIVSEFAQKVIDVRRVARVVAGGRRFSFSVAIVIGDRKGSVGVGIGKASETARAIEKATRRARRSMIKIKTTSTMSIPHEVEAKYGSARVVLMPARGKGLVAGSSVRNVLELAGLTDIAAKVRSRSKNKLNNAQAALTALGQLTQNNPNK